MRQSYILELLGADLDIKLLRGMGVHSVLPGGIFNLEKLETIFVQIMV